MVWILSNPYRMRNLRMSLACFVEHLWLIIVLTTSMLTSYKLLQMFKIFLFKSIIYKVYTDIVYYVYVIHCQGDRYRRSSSFSPSYLVFRSVRPRHPICMGTRTVYCIISYCVSVTTWHFILNLILLVRTLERFTRFTLGTP